MQDGSRTARSRVSNGKSLFLARVDDRDIDGRTVYARRFRDVLEAIVSDLGGREAISEAEYQLARRCAALSLKAETMETFLVSGRTDEFDTELYATLTNALGRAFSRIGLKRRARDVTPDPLEYAARVRGAE